MDIKKTSYKKLSKLLSTFEKKVSLLSAQAHTLLSHFRPSQCTTGHQVRSGCDWTSTDPICR